MKYKTIRVTSGSFGNGVKSLIFHLSELTPQKAAGLTIETFSMDDDKLIFLALPKESPFANYLMNDFEEIKEIDFNSFGTLLFDFNGVTKEAYVPLEYSYHSQHSSSFDLDFELSESHSVYARHFLYSIFELTMVKFQKNVLGAVKKLQFDLEKEDKKNNFHQMHINQHIGLMYYILNDYSRSLTYLKESTKYEGDDVVISHAAIQIIKYLHIEKNITEAIKALPLVMQVSNSSRVQEMYKEWITINKDAFKSNESYVLNVRKENGKYEINADWEISPGYLSNIKKNLLNFLNYEIQYNNASNKSKGEVEIKFDTIKFPVMINIAKFKTTGFEYKELVWLMNEIF